MRLLKNIFFLLTIIGITAYIYINREDFSVLAQVSVTHVIALLFIGLVGIVINALQFKIVAKIFDVDLNFNEWFGLSSVGTMYSYLLPAKAGIAVRGAYLKKKYDFPYAHSTSILAGSYLITFLITAFISTTLGAWFFFNGQLQPLFFLLPVGILLLIAMLIVFLLRTNIDPTTSKNRFFRFIKNTYNGLQFFKKHPKRLFTLCILQLSVIVVNTFRLAFAFHLLHINIDFTQLLFVQSFVVFGTIISLLPANLVIKEGIIGFAAGFLGITIENALLGAIFDRIVIMLLVFLFGIIWSRILLDKLETVDKGKVGNE